MNRITLKKLMTIAKDLGYRPFDTKSWKEFDEEDYYRIIQEQCKIILITKYGY